MGISGRVSMASIAATPSVSASVLHTRVPMDPAAPVTISVSIASLNFLALVSRFALRYLNFSQKNDYARFIHIFSKVTDITEFKTS